MQRISPASRLLMGAHFRQENPVMTLKLAPSVVIQGRCRFLGTKEGSFKDAPGQGGESVRGSLSPLLFDCYLGMAYN